MPSLRQIRFEIKHILKSKFILIIGILVLATGIAIPVISLLGQRSKNHTHYPMGMWDSGMFSQVAYDSMWYPEDSEAEPIIVDGITIQADNPLYWYIKNVIEEKGYMETDRGNFSSSEVLDLALSLMDEEQKFYVHLAQHITKPMDYRTDLAWFGMGSIHDKFIYEHHHVPEEKLFEAIINRVGVDLETFKEKYINITPEQRLAALDEVDEKLNTLYNAVENNDFPQFVNLRIKQEKDNIENLKEQIAIQEKVIIENPIQEKEINYYIEDLKREIEMIETSNIPTLEYRLEKNIIPGEAIWQNAALENIESYRRNLLHAESQTEEQFNKDMFLIQQYKTYQRYLSTMQAERDEYNNQILIGQRSLDANKPDMKFVPMGARKRTVDFLSYSLFVTMFAILVGGWIIASEFQQGTIRLLMIRPKTRAKILMAKYIAALLISIGIYVLGSLFNLLTNGACFGFSDFSYPNFTISGEINFFSYYVPKFLACAIPIIFAYTTAFLLSVLIKNVAVSIVIPIAFFIGSSILLPTFAYSNGMVNWIAYTPIPYVEIFSFFSEYSPVKYAIQMGVPLNLSYGLIMLLVLSAVCIIFAIFTFKKRDITN